MKRLTIYLSLIAASMLIPIKSEALQETPPEPGWGIFEYPDSKIESVGYFGEIDGIYYFYGTQDIGDWTQAPRRGIIAPPPGKRYGKVLKIPKMLTCPPNPYEVGSGEDHSVFFEIFRGALTNSPVEEIIFTASYEDDERVVSGYYYNIESYYFEGADKLTTITIERQKYILIEGSIFAHCPLKKINAPKDATLYIRYLFDGADVEQWDFSANKIIVWQFPLKTSKLQRLTIRSDSELKSQSLYDGADFRSLHFVGDLEPGTTVCPLTSAADVMGRCPVFEELVLDWTTPPTLTADFYATEAEGESDHLERIRIYVPDGSVELYRQAEVWKNYKHILPKSQLGAVTDITAEKTAVSTRVYDLQGRPADATTARGILIKQTTWSDGTVTTDKLVR